MKIEISFGPSDHFYNWKMWDGPDGIDEYKGKNLSLGGVFEQIQTHRVLGALKYQIAEKKKND
ncbi:MAG: hypothetical protein ACO24H_06300 [Polynucleobacter sp.]